MSNSSLENKKSLFVKSSKSKNNAKEMEFENDNQSLMNSVVNSMDKIDDNFEDLCKQKCINDEKSLQIYHDVAVTGKVIEKFICKLKNVDLLCNFIQTVK